MGAVKTPSTKALPVAQCINSKCASLSAPKAAVDCTKSACESECTCSLSACADEIATCLDDATCAQAQGCALGCSCGDSACSLQCAVKTPSTKALPVAQCINSKCASLSAPKAAVDCTKSACESECTCSLSACADEIATCLADATRAQAQGCALGCACGDSLARCSVQSR